MTLRYKFRRCRPPGARALERGLLSTHPLSDGSMDSRRVRAARSRARCSCAFIAPWLLGKTLDGSVRMPTLASGGKGIGKVLAELRCEYVVDLMQGPQGDEFIAGYCVSNFANAYTTGADSCFQPFREVETQLMVISR